MNWHTETLKTRTNKFHAIYLASQLSSDLHIFSLYCSSSSPITITFVTYICFYLSAHKHIFFILLQVFFSIKVLSPYTKNNKIKVHIYVNQVQIHKNPPSKNLLKYIEKKRGWLIIYKFVSCVKNVERASKTKIVKCVRKVISIIIYKKSV